MGLFRRNRDETQNEILLREAHLDRPDEPPDPDPAPDVWYEVLRGAFERPAEFDVVMTAELPQLSGDQVEFAALPNGELIVDEEQGDGDLSSLADEVEQEVGAPYRVVARREEGDRWKVAAREIDVVELTLRGDEIELVCEGGVRELRVDGEPSSAEIPELARAEEALGSDFVVQADRLDGDLWEIRASPL
jgi:hypothetical protein